MINGFKLIEAYKKIEINNGKSLQVYTAYSLKLFDNEKL